MEHPSFLAFQKGQIAPPWDYLVRVIYVFQEFGTPSDPLVSLSIPFDVIPPFQRLGSIPAPYSYASITASQAVKSP